MPYSREEEEGKEVDERVRKLFVLFQGCPDLGDGLHEHCLIYPGGGDLPASNRWSDTMNPVETGVRDVVVGR